MIARPILFSAPMIRALLDGRKTQTRRIVKPQPEFLYGLTGDRLVGSPYQIGQLLYVKEATWIWCKRVLNGTTKTGRPKYRFVPVGRHVVYCADGDKPTHRIDDHPDHGWRYKTARFMPRWVSSLTLRLTDVRVQRVQEISEEDALTEGAEPARCRDDGDCLSCPDCGFRSLWDSINAKRGFGWDANPWVWALSFEVILANVDAGGW